MGEYGNDFPDDVEDHSEDELNLSIDAQQAMLSGKSYGVAEQDTVADEEQFFKICCRVHADHPYHYAVYRWIASLPRNRRGLEKISAHMLAALNLYVDVLQGKSKVVPMSLAPISAPVPVESHAQSRLRGGFAQFNLESRGQQRVTGEDGSGRRNVVSDSSGGFTELGATGAAGNPAVSEVTPDVLAGSSSTNVSSDVAHDSRLDQAQLPVDKATNLGKDKLDSIGSAAGFGTPDSSKEARKVDDGLGYLEKVASGDDSWA